MKNNTEHTPGPWQHSRMTLPIKAKDRRSGFVVNGPEHMQTPELPIRICDLRVPSGIRGYSEGEANARLIAAAPDLLEALQKCRAWLERLVDKHEDALYRGPAGALEAAREAIAKAEGKARA